METKPNNVNTDFVGETVNQNGKKKAEKGAKQRRQDNYRRQKNVETDNAIMTGIFARLKISDPTAVSSLPLAVDNHPVTVPVVFSCVPTYVDRVWDTMEAIGTRPFGQINTPLNKNIFKKGVLILCETKVCFAQRAHVDEPDEDLPSKKLYNSEELNDFNNMASILPYPIAILLESIGNCIDNKQIVTPLQAELQTDAYHAASGALTYAPRQLLPLLHLLHAGVPLDGEVHGTAQTMANLPFIAWEEFVGAAIPHAVPPAAPLRMVKITDQCYNAWVEEINNQRYLKWTDHEYRIFVQIVQSMNSKPGFNVATDLSPGQGTMAQTVQVKNWNVGRTTEWFTMSEVDEFNIKLGAAFGLSDVGENDIQPSKFRGTYTTSYLRGEITCANTATNFFRAMLQK